MHGYAEIQFTLIVNKDLGRDAINLPHVLPRRTEKCTLLTLTAEVEHALCGHKMKELIAIKLAAQLHSRKC